MGTAGRFPPLGQYSLVLAKKLIRGHNQIVKEHGYGVRFRRAYPNPEDTVARTQWPKPLGSSEPINSTRRLSRVNARSGLF